MKFPTRWMSLCVVGCVFGSRVGERPVDAAFMAQEPETTYAETPEIETATTRAMAGQSSTRYYGSRSTAREYDVEKLYDSEKAKYDSYKNPYTGAKEVPYGERIRVSAKHTAGIPREESEYEKMHSTDQVSDDGLWKESVVGILLSDGSIFPLVEPYYYYERFNSSVESMGEYRPPPGPYGSPSGAYGPVDPMAARMHSYSPKHPFGVRDPSGTPYDIPSELEEADMYSDAMETMQAAVGAADAAVAKMSAAEKAEAAKRAAEKAQMSAEEMEYYDAYYAKYENDKTFAPVLSLSSYDGSTTGVVEYADPLKPDSAATKVQAIKVSTFDIEKLAAGKKVPFAALKKLPSNSVHVKSVTDRIPSMTLGIIQPPMPYAEAVELSSERRELSKKNSYVPYVYSQPTCSTCYQGKKGFYGTKFGKGNKYPITYKVPPKIYVHPKRSAYGMYGGWGKKGYVSKYPKYHPRDDQDHKPEENPGENGEDSSEDLDEDVEEDVRSDRGSTTFEGRGFDTTDTSYSSRFYSHNRPESAYPSSYSRFDSPY